MSDELWYLGRASGVTALVLFTLVVVLGILTRTGRRLPGLPRFAAQTLHRSTSLTAVGFLVVHVGSLLLDPYAQLRLVDVVLPFRGAYRPLWQGLGTTAFDLVLVLVVSSLLRRHLGLRAWRIVHWSAYLCWPLAMAHALGNGTDRATAWLLATAAVCGGAVLAAVAYRAFGRWGGASAVRPLEAPPHLAGLR